MHNIYLKGMLMVIPRSSLSLNVLSALQDLNRVTTPRKTYLQFNALKHSNYYV